MKARALLERDVSRLRQLGREAGPRELALTFAAVAAAAFGTHQALLLLQEAHRVVQWSVLHLAGLVIFTAVGLASLRYARTFEEPADALDLRRAVIGAWATARASVAHALAGVFVGAPLLFEPRIAGDLLLWTAWSTGSFSGTAVVLLAALVLRPKA